MAIETRRALACGLLGIALVACRSAPTPPSARYTVTKDPIDVGVMSTKMCVAVEPTNPQGVWHWLPGSSGCSSRSTGPDVFHADQATVTASPQTGAIDIRFRLQLILPTGSTQSSFPDVVLVLQHGVMRAPASGAQVSTEPRPDLDVPERP